MESLDSAIVIVGAVQGVFISFILLSKKENRRSNIFLSFFLIIISIGMAMRYLALSGLIIEEPRKIFGPILLIFPSLIGPLIFFYVKSMLSQMRSFTRKDLIHFLPSMLIFFLALTIPFLFPGEVDISKNYNFRMFILTILGFSISLGLIYSIVSIIRLREHEKHVEDYFSDKDKITLSWMKILLFVIIFFFIIWNTIFWINFLIFEGNKPHLAFQIMMRSMIVFLIFLISYYALKQPEIFDETISMEKNLADEDENNSFQRESSPVKYEKHNLDELMRKKYYKVLKEYMFDKKPYLDENITIKNLADILNISTHHLSIVINSEFNLNFYNFINSFRIEEVKNRLISTGDLNKNILEIAYSVGFNSKSTFNTFFKKTTGMTPTEYRRSLA